MYSSINSSAVRNESILTPTGDFADVLINGMVNEDDYDALPLVILLPETDNITLLEMQGAVSEKGAEMGVDLSGSSLAESVRAAHCSKSTGDEENVVRLPHHRHSILRSVRVGRQTW